MRSFLLKQGELLFRKQHYALFLVIALSSLPLTGWLSLSIVALMTLRLGALESMKFLFAGIAASLISITMVSVEVNDAVPMIFISYLSVYALACLQRTVASWRFTGMIALLAALIAVVIIHTWAIEYVIRQIQDLVTVFSQIKQAEGLVELLKTATTSADMFLPNYLLGVKAVAEMVSILSAVIIARYVQSLVFYPEGFRKELFAFRASKSIVLLMMICLAGVYVNDTLAFSCLPLLASYLTVAGICVCVNLLAGRKSIVVFIMLALPLITAPTIMLPVYVILGSLDSLFNFRLRVPVKAAKYK